MFPPQAKLSERDGVLSARQAQILELHTELSHLQRLLQQGPTDSPARRLSTCYSPGRVSRGGAEEAMAAATSGGWLAVCDVTM